uniref:acetamidase/formamidase family protein n=1 Tax=Rhizomonospora bruguierae TaxID=1581705 RepID=UPI001BD18AA4
MGQIHRYTPTLDDLAYTFGGRLPVVHLAAAGDVLVTFTEDCFGGAVRTVEDLPSNVCDFPYLNPVTGPFFIEDAEPGDTIAVHFLAITPARPMGVSSTFPHF